MGTTGKVWPADAVGGVPAYPGRLLREGQSPSFAGATSARPFGAISGVRPGTSVTTVTATSTTWTAQVFAGVIDLEASNLAGPYCFMFDAVTSGSVTASNASQIRTDALAVVISDPAEGDGTSNPLVTLVYTNGTLGSASPPAAPARGFNVAQLAFPAGSGTTPTVTWLAPNATAAGGVIPIPTSASLASLPVYPGLLAVADDTDTLWECTSVTGPVWRIIGESYVPAFVVAGSGAQSIGSTLTTITNWASPATNRGFTSWTSSVLTFARTGWYSFAFSTGFGTGGQVTFCFNNATFEAWNESAHPNLAKLRYCTAGENFRVQGYAATSQALTPARQFLEVFFLKGE